MFLQTKLFLPKPPVDVILRPRLINALKQGAHRPVTIVTAPAGYGKTTLIATWLAHDSAPHPRAWLTLDEHDSAPLPFFRALLAALRHNFPDSSFPNPENILVSDSPVSLTRFLPHLSNVLSSLPEFSFFLDDYHTLTAPEIHEGMAYFIEQLPSHVHLILTSRTDPPLPLARLRAQNRLTELGPDDLRFTSEEIKSYFQAYTPKLSPEILQTITEKTEGWAASLQLLALSVQNTTDPARLLKEFTGSHPHIFNYLAEEVFNRQPERVRTFLLQSSILKRLSRELCEAVIGYWILDIYLNTQQTVTPTQFFLNPLDASHTWFRYHPLFSDFLNAKLLTHSNTRGAGINEIHHRAAIWYWENKLPTDAMYHALAGEDFSLVVRIFFACVGDFMQRGEILIVSGWLDAMPAELIYRLPGLVMWRAWTYALTGQNNLVEDELQKGEGMLAQLEVEGRLPDQQKAIFCWTMTALRSFVARREGDIERMIQYTRQAQSLNISPKNTNHLLLAQNLTEYYLHMGNTRQAVETLTESLRVFQDTKHRSIFLTSLGKLGEATALRGHLHEAASLYRRGLHYAEEKDCIHLSAPLEIRLGGLLREWNQLDQAQALIEQGLNRALQNYWILSACEGYRTLARCCFSQGNLLALHKTLAEATQTAEQYQIPKELALIRLEEARLAALAGNVVLVKRWMQTASVSYEDDLGYESEQPHLVLARATLTLDRPHYALVLLNRLRDAAQAAERITPLIEAQVLTALAHQASGDLSAALQSLNLALELAEPNGFVRLFLDEGNAIVALLEVIQERKMCAYATRLLEISRFRSGAVEASLVENLSPREMDVLRLLVQGLSDKEISGQLFIAPTTVIWHNQNIFRKLGVSNRTQAAARARDMGLVE